MTWTVRIAGWHPARINELLGDWRRASRRKKQDRVAIALPVSLAKVPRATGKRRVSVEIVLGPRQRGGDPDAYHKSLLDALKHCGAILDDRRQCVELTPVTYSRGPQRATVVTLEDVAEEKGAA